MAFEPQSASEAALGLAWQVRGMWHADGRDAAIQSGDSIAPGSLLRPAGAAASHSITILLPDGQSVLYECFTVQDCARGFRVPSLNLEPEPFAVEMLARMRAGLIRESQDRMEASFHQAHSLPRDEVAAALDSSNRVQVEGLAAKLANGRYTYDLRPLDRSKPPRFNVALEKNGPSITVTVPSAGLYIATIADDQNTPRIDLFIAAVDLANAASVTRSFSEARALLRRWIESYYGWPIHRLQWAYLESLSSDPQRTDAGSDRATTMRASSVGSEAEPARRTSEPIFFPKPGWLDGNASITLRCDTPGATIRYTVDGSQPVSSSAVYGAPIILKGKGLTIMAFANTPGKRDSAVITGNFRIRQSPQ